MPNGRGTPDCHNCKHHHFAAEPNADGCYQAICRYYSIELPRGLKPEDRLLHPHIGSLNLFCTRHEASEPEHAAPLPEALRMNCQDDILYAIFYNDIGLYTDSAPARPPDSLVSLLDLPHDRRPNAPKA
jgi:hypothetical protein